MNQEMLSCNYSGTMTPIVPGDVALIDDREVEIVNVLHAGTEVSEDYGCFETGGLLLRSLDLGLEVIPFGHCHTIRLKVQ